MAQWNIVVLSSIPKIVSLHFVRLRSSKWPKLTALSVRQEQKCGSVWIWTISMTWWSISADIWPMKRRNCKYVLIRFICDKICILRPSKTRAEMQVQEQLYIKEPNDNMGWFLRGPTWVAGWLLVVTSLMFTYPVSITYPLYRLQITGIFLNYLFSFVHQLRPSEPSWSSSRNVRPYVCICLVPFSCNFF